MHEKERSADPCDRRRHVQPAQKRRTPFPAEGLQSPHQPASSERDGCARPHHDKGGHAVWVASRLDLWRQPGMLPLILVLLLLARRLALYRELRPSMKIIPLPIHGAVTVMQEQIGDDR